MGARARLETHGSGRAYGEETFFAASFLAFFSTALGDLSFISLLVVEAVRRLVTSADSMVSMLEWREPSAACPTYLMSLLSLFRECIGVFWNGNYHRRFDVKAEKNGRSAAILEGGARTQCRT